MTLSKRILKTEDSLAAVVERLHACYATFKQTVPVREMHGDDIVWEGVVHVFSLKGHPKTNRCYAWSSPVEGSNKRKFYAVLHIPPIDSPEKAVRASIVQDYRFSR